MDDLELALPGVKAWLVIGFSAYVCNGRTLGRVAYYADILRSS